MGTLSMEMTTALIQYPSWVLEWLRIGFYEQKCSIHVHRYRTVYCTACMGTPFCDYCWKEAKLKHHQGHEFLQVCTASSRAAIWVEDIKRLLDVSGIQTYINNSKYVVYLNPSNHQVNIEEENNNQIQNQKQNFPLCQVCHRKLKESKYNFCSIACKKHSMERLHDKNIERIQEVGSLKGKARLLQEIGPCTQEENGSQKQKYSSVQENGGFRTPKVGPFAQDKNGLPPTHRKKLRKRIPVRSPLM